MARSCTVGESCRQIIHLNIADFAVAVERIGNPDLASRPVIIAPAGGQRARVYDMSEEAYQAGVRKGMPLYRARRRCRDAEVLAPHPARYERAMARLLPQVLPYSPLIESGEMDGHVFVDVTGTGRINGPARDAASRISTQIRQHLGFSPAWAVASSKLVAKAATRIVKPAGHYWVDPGQEAAFLASLPVDLIPGIGADDLVRLGEFNLRTAGQVASLGIDQLEEVFGRRAGRIFNAVCGIDSSPVAPLGQKSSSVEASSALGGDTHFVSVVEAVLYMLVEKIGTELRKRDRAARSLVITIDYVDGRRCFRQTGIDPPAVDDITLFEVSARLLRKAWVRRVRLANVYLSCPGPVAFQVQKELFREPGGFAEKRVALMDAVDRIRQRFGTGAVCTGRVMAR